MMLFSTTKTIVLRGVMVVSAVAAAVIQMPPTDQPTSTFEPTLEPTKFEDEGRCEDDNKTMYFIVDGKKKKCNGFNVSQCDKEYAFKFLRNTRRFKGKPRDFCRKLCDPNCPDDDDES